jgi:uncharacterized membrane protein
LSGANIGVCRIERETAEQYILLTNDDDQVLQLQRLSMTVRLFCAFCGAPQAGATPSGGPPPQARAPGPQTGGIRPNLAGALACPLGAITGILFLKIEPYKHDPFVRFHAFQSIFLSFSCAVLFVGWSMFVGLLFDLRLGFLFSFVGPVMVPLQVACILLVPFMMYKAFKFEYFSLPLIGPLAARWAG